ncbi:hypothetical protein PMIN06_011011 [Paraphaeosphaeria minitans]|uniref:Uncharacterized protein n=1 Tax=Paraphaeosphaeria minitans TaxID=565426 RepID=A0A9P6KPQ4_9PLEO|nr:hypothetical protein PMIN01_06353 [Paraphaeosphaeria minitans]
MSKPYSKSVRGTFDNPKTKAAIKAGDNPPRIGDPTSVMPETYDDTSDSWNAAQPLVPSSSSDTNDDDMPNFKNGDDLPHSKEVRGTLANPDGKKVNKTQLGDPASLKAETSGTDMDKQTEREGLEKSKL